MWTDISVGALYGAIKRLAGEGLLAEVRTEREGSYPERQVYGVTDAGRTSLADLQRRGLLQVAFKPDPFDLALCRPDPDRLDEMAGAIRDRLTTMEAMLAEIEAANRRAGPYLSIGETHALLHRTHRLRAEVSWHQELIAALPDVIADERTRALAPDPLPTQMPSKDHSHG